MHATKRTGTLALVGALVMVVAGLTPATADPPTAVVERTVVEETRLSPNLTEDCGVPVTVHLSGTRKFTEYLDRKGEYGQVAFRHTAMWKEVVLDDGTWLFHESGQGPLGQKGHFLSDITAKEIVLQQAATSIEEGIAGFCAVLNP